jgi:hypothetical protein
MKTIKKAQSGTTVKDKTAVAKSKRKPVPVSEKSDYHFLKSSEKGKAPSKQDSITYDKGYNMGRRRKNPIFFTSDMNEYMGSVEGSIDKKPKQKLKLKSGGSVKAKDGKWMQKAAASIKRRGTEGKCTPITKPGCTGKAKALAKTFKKIAAKRKGK